MAKKIEIVIITGPTQTIPYTDTRRSNFGDFPKVQVWMLDNDGLYYLSDVQPGVDGAPANFTQFEFDFGGAVTGFIVLK